MDNWKTGDNSVLPVRRGNCGLEAVSKPQIMFESQASRRLETEEAHTSVPEYFNPRDNAAIEHQMGFCYKFSEEFKEITGCYDYQMLLNCRDDRFQKFNASKRKWAVTEII